MNCRCHVWIVSMVWIKLWDGFKIKLPKFICGKCGELRDKS